MATFLYRAQTSVGEYEYGSYSCNEKSELEKHLDSLEFESFEIMQSKTPFKKGQYSLVSAKELSLFCKQISVMFFSYITIIDGVLLLSEQTDNKYLKDTFIEIHDFLENGYTFAEAISMYSHIFGSYLIEMAILGEKTGTLETVFSDLSDYFDKEHEIRKRMRSAVIYPASLSAVTLLIFTYLIKSVLPMFNSILLSLGATMTTSTTLIMSFSVFLDKYLILILFFIVAIFGGIYIYHLSDSGKYKIDKLKFRLPYYSFIVSRLVTAKFSRSLSLLLRSGINIYEALDQSASMISNTYLYENFKIAIKKIEEGETLTNALKSANVFPSLFIKMVTIGEKTGNLDEMLVKTTEVYEEEAYEALTKVSKLIEPVLITILSIIMGIVLICVMIPMISIMNAM